MTTSTKFTKRSKKLSDDLSKNHEQRIRYRKRLQEDKEREEELKDFIKDNNGTTPRLW